MQLQLGKQNPDVIIFVINLRKSFKDEFRNSSVEA
jgi:hypothetical protein